MSDRFNPDAPEYRGTAPKKVSSGTLAEKIGHFPARLEKFCELLKNIAADPQWEDTLLEKSAYKRIAELNPIIEGITYYHNAMQLPPELGQDETARAAFSQATAQFNSNMRELAKVMSSIEIRLPTTEEQQERNLPSLKVSQLRSTIDGIKKEWRAIQQMKHSFIGRNSSSSTEPSL